MVITLRLLIHNDWRTFEELVLFPLMEYGNETYPLKSLGNGFFVQPKSTT